MAESIQKKLGRVRPPRVQITYDVETGGALEKKELPFIVGIFADLAVESPLAPKPVSERKLVDIDRDTFDKVLETLQPAVSLTKVKNVLPDDEKIDEASKGETLLGSLGFKSIDDFAPLAVTLRVGPLERIYKKRARLRDFQAKLETAPALYAAAESLFAKEPGEDAKKLLAELEAAFPKDKTPADWAGAEPGETVKKLLLSQMTADDDSDERKQYARQLLGQFLWDAVKRELKFKDDAEKAAVEKRGVFARFDHRVAELDAVLTAQLNEVLHTEKFRALEATWRGLHYLVSRAETGPMLKLRVMSITKEELHKELDTAVEFDQSTIFKQIYEAEYGTFGGKPYSMLLGDYEFGRTPLDFNLLHKMSQIAAAAHAPFIASAYAKLFDLATFEHLANPRDLSKIFESLELIGWTDFRKSEDSRYVSLTLPRVLLRLPYGGEKGQAVEGFAFEETVVKADKAVDPNALLWGNSAYVLAERITNAFSLYGWTAAFRGVEGGGLVEGLPTYTFDSAEGDIKLVCPTQVSITDRREKELNDLGFMAICHCKGSGQAAFFGGQTTNLPKKYFSDAANANAQISAMLPYVLCASRFAHYVKVMMRDKVGSFLTRANVESYLNSWISNYVLLDDNATQEAKAAYPLRAAKVVVTDVPGRPGSYKATIFLKPHFQLEELTASIRLVADIPG